MYLDESNTADNNPVKGFFWLNYGETLWPRDENAFMSKVRIRGEYTEIAGTGPRGYDRVYGTQNTMYKKSGTRTEDTALNSQGYVLAGTLNKSNALAFDPMRSDSTDSFPGTPIAKNLGELNSSTDISLTSSSPRPALSLIETNCVSISGTYSDYSERLVEQMSGKTRWYNSYDDYAENIRGLMKETSIIPEFRISEHMDYYISEQGGNFRAENKSFLTLLGAEYSSSAASPSDLNFDVNFEKTYIDSDKFDHLKKITDDHLEHSTPSHITLTATGIKKLLPYNGFYPDTRTVQMGNLLSQSLAGNIVGYKFDETRPEAIRTLTPDQGWHTFLKTFQSPGVLYNSIQGGVAMDYPIYTSSVPTASTAVLNPLKVVPLERSPDMRVSFESLYNFNEYLPKNTDFFLATSIPGEENPTFFPEANKYYSRWNGKKKPNFELASHNFLASTVDFFLSNGELNSFVSSPEIQFASVEKDKKYYMDVVLRDEMGMSRNVEYSGRTTAFPASQIVTENLEISASDRWGASNAVCPSPAGGAYVLATANLAPHAGYDKVGKASLTYTDDDGNIADLDENGILTGSGPEHWPGTHETRYGQSCAMASGSDGLIFAIGEPRSTIPAPAPDPTTDGRDQGRVYFYRYDDSLIPKLQLIYTAHPGGDGQMVHYGSAVAVSSGSTSGISFYSMPTCDIASPAQELSVQYHEYAGGSTINFVSASTISDFSGTYSSTSILAATTSSAGDIIVCRQLAPGYAPNEQKTYKILNNNHGVLFTNTILPVETSTQIQDLDVCQFHNDSTGIGTFLFQAAILRGHTLGSSPWTGSVNIDLHTVTPATIYASATGSVSLDVPLGYESSSYGRSVSIETLVDSVGTHTVLAAIGNVANLAEDQKMFISSVDLNLAGDIDSSNLLYEISPSLTQDIQEWPWGIDMKIGDSGEASDLFVVAGAPSYDADGLSVLTSAGYSQLIYAASRETNYKIHGSLFGMPIDGLYDPAYCAYTPPGFYGESIARMAFSSSTAGDIPLDELLADTRVENISLLDRERVRTLSGESAVLTPEQLEAKSTISSSVSLFGKSIEKKIQFSISEDGETTTADRATEGTSETVRWAISTKFECPVLDNSSSLYRSNYSSHVSSFEDEPEWGFDGAGSWEPPRNVWTSYGSVLPPDKGYEFELRESYPKNTFNTLQTGSLVELCGFTAGTKKVGTPADQKEISEAIMIVPYLDRKIPYKTIEIENGKHFIKASKTEVKKQKKNIEDKGYAISEDTIETSISKTINSMKKFVVPPQYDYIKYNDITPFVSYFLEFDHTLSQKDLLDIWQGVTPTIAISPETDEVRISHNFDKHNFFYNLDFPSDIKFMVFKVKQKAKWNYYDITKDSSDDNRFRFDFQGDGQTEVVPDYNYNWPYDFCTLVERAKVDVNVIFRQGGAALQDGLSTAAKDILCKDETE